jgi:hypothetical protein
VRLRCVLTALVVGLIASATCEARADPAPVAESPSIPPELAAAARAFEQGDTLSVKGKAAAACKRFAASQRLWSSSGTLLRLGVCYDGGYLPGGLLKARAAFERALAELDAFPGPGQRETLRAAAEQKLAEIEPRIPSLRLASPPTAGAEVRLNAKRFESFDVDVPMNPGHYRIELRAGSCEPYVVQFELAVGQHVARSLPALERCRFRNAPGGLGIAGVGLATLWVLAAKAAYQADHDYSRLVDRCSAELCDRYTRQQMHDKRQEARNYAQAVDYGLAPATILTLGAAFTLWWVDTLAVRNSQRESAGLKRVEAACSSTGCLLRVGSKF